MDFSQLRNEHYNATITQIERVHEHLIKIRVVPDGDRLEYQPGQYTILALGGWENRIDGPSQIENEKLQGKLIKRAYSVSCPMIDEQGALISCTDYDFLEFYITLVVRSDTEIPKRPPLTPRLFTLNEGDRVHMARRVVGHYTLGDVGPDDHVVFAATGTGEAPHNAMAAELLKRGHRGNIASMTCVRYRGDAGYLSEQAKLEELFPNYRYRLYTTREPSNLDSSREDFSGKRYLQDVVQPGVFEQEFGWAIDPARTHVFLCGNPDMIGIPEKNSEGKQQFPETKGMIEILCNQGLVLAHGREPGNIHFEKYW
ncbi:MAG: ferredoxin--NADP reductase [Planctomycetaceae bacterium]|nr:ferredoxin--NADP reductase [Planctomycetaceae bacterium]